MAEYVRLFCADPALADRVAMLTFHSDPATDALVRCLSSVICIIEDHAAAWSPCVRADQSQALPLSPTGQYAAAHAPHMPVPELQRAVKQGRLLQGVFHTSRCVRVRVRVCGETLFSPHHPPATPAYTFKHHLTPAHSGQRDAA